MTVYDDFELKVSLVTYKPTWKFKVIYQGLEAGVEAIQLFVTYKTQDIVTKEVIELDWKVGVSDFLLEVLVDQEYFKHFISNVVKDMEMHEVNEWLKYAGECITNPHPELKGAKQI